MRETPLGLPRPWFHAARVAVAILFWPALALIAWGELTPDVPDADFGVFDKLLHFTAYFGLAGMAACGFRRRGPVVAAVLILIGIGGLLEILQGFTGRDPDIYDELANAFGALTGGFLARLIVEPLRRSFANHREKEKDAADVPRI
jgi:hypothetical protein